MGEVYGIDELEAEMQRPGPGGREPVVPHKLLRRANVDTNELP